MAKTLSRKVVIYIDGKPAEASLQQLNAQIAKLSNEQKKLPIGAGGFCAEKNGGVWAAVQK